VLAIVAREVAADVRPSRSFVVRRELRGEVLFHRSLSTDLDSGLPSEARGDAFVDQVANVVLDYLGEPRPYRTASVRVDVQAGNLIDCDCRINGIQAPELKTGLSKLAWPNHLPYTFDLFFVTP
jgi:hypothetical protein